jgi:preprotein translocase subunit Sec61beta
VIQRNFKGLSGHTPTQGRTLMSRRAKRRKDEAPMPAASAGLLRFFEDETPGFKVRPEVVILMAVGLIVVSLFAYVMAK